MSIFQNQNYFVYVFMYQITIIVCDDTVELLISSLPSFW